jgi:predicted phage terminase large subunit-like protein
MARKSTIAELQKKVEEERYKLCENNFYFFLKTCWKFMDTSTFIDSWHVQMLCDHLQAQYEGVPELKKLCINIHPRLSKSLICSVAYPCWLWLKNPAEEIMIVSHTIDLIYQFNTSARNLLKSTWFSTYWIEEKKVFEFSKDFDTKKQFNNSKGGRKFGTSPGSKIIGKGANQFILDDVNDRSEAFSPAELQKKNEFYLGTLKNRANSINSKWLNIQQRIHPNDFTGWLMEHEQHDWTFLVLPAEYTKKHIAFKSPIGVNDPRTKEGEVICPDRFPSDYYYSIKSDPFIWSSMYQQDPQQLGGNVIKQEWIKFYNESIEVTYFDELVISVDLAAEVTEETDYSVFAVFGKKENKIYLIDLLRAKLEFADQVKSLLSLTKKYPGTAVLIEMKSNGNALYDTFKRLIPKVIASTPSNQISKLHRVYATVPSYVAGNIYMPSVELQYWMQDVLDELLAYPKSLKNDVTDAITQAINYYSTFSPETVTYIPKTKKNLYTSTVEDLKVTLRYGITENPTHIWR